MRSLARQGHLRETLTRADLRDAVYESLPQLSRADASRLVDEAFAEISRALEQGEDVKLHGFGAFKVREKRARLGRNPKNLVEAVITARRVVSFVASPNLRARVSGRNPVKEKGRLAADLGLQVEQSPQRVAARERHNGED
jgi:integration host factor subunit alpha